MATATMIFFGCFLLIYINFVDAQNCSDYYKCQLELYEQLLSQSRPSIRPIQFDSQKIQVSLGFSLIKFVSVNEEDSLLTIRAHLNQTWNTSIFIWDPSKYSNVQHIRVPAHSVWTPKIELINPSTTIDSEKNHYINVQSNGVFELSYSTLLTISCDFNLQDFPFDQQKCTFNLGSALYDSDEVSIARALDVVIDDGNLMPSGFYFVSHSIEPKKVFFAGFDQNYDQISIQLNIHRRPKYFLRLISWPGTILILLGLTIFLLPPSATERIVYGSLLLICQFILLTIFAFHVPKRLGSTWPWMGRMILYDIFTTAVLLFFSVLIRMIAERKHCATERPSSRIRNFAFGYLSKLVGLKQSLYNTQLANRDNEYDTSDLGPNDGTMEPLTSVSNSSSTAAAAASTDHLSGTSTLITRDIGTIKQKFNTLFHEHTVEQEWLLLAHILNRLCFLLYLLLNVFAVGHHLFSS